MGLWTVVRLKVSIASGADQTFLLVKTATNHQLKIHEIGFFQFGVTPTQAPTEFHIGRCTTDGTSTAVVPKKWNDSDGDTIDFTAADLFTVEPTYTDKNLVFSVHPQTGIVLPFPRPLIVGGGGDRVGVLIKNMPSATNTAGYMLVEE